jgi:hypothetical protein
MNPETPAGHLGHSPDHESCGQLRVYTDSIEEVDLSDKEVQKVLDFILKIYNDKNDDLYGN